MDILNVKQFKLGYKLTSLSCLNVFTLSKPFVLYHSHDTEARLFKCHFISRAWLFINRSLAKHVIFEFCLLFNEQEHKIEIGYRIGKAEKS